MTRLKMLKQAKRKKTFEHRAKVISAKSVKSEDMEKLSDAQKSRVQRLARDQKSIFIHKGIPLKCIDRASCGAKVVNIDDMKVIYRVIRGHQGTRTIKILKIVTDQEISEKISSYMK